MWYSCLRNSYFLLLDRFLLQCLDDLDSNLRKLNSRLFVIRGQPANVFPRLFKVKFFGLKTLLSDLNYAIAFLEFLVPFWNPPAPVHWFSFDHVQRLSMFVFCSLRSGKSPGWLLSMTQNHLGRRGMRLLRSSLWRPALKSSSRSRTPFTILTSKNSIFLCEGVKQIKRQL